jgi:hypothetical protein
MSARQLGHCSLLLLSTPLLVLSVSFLGCSRRHEGNPWTGTIRDSAGVVIVENTSVGLWGRGQNWVLEEELRFGGLGGELPYQFGQIGTIAVDSEGQIHVSDVQAQEVRVFSRDGKYLRATGRPGSGPGELALGASVVLISPGDTVLIPDIRNRRINRFAPDGRTLGSVPLEPEKGRPLRYNLTPAGRMTAQIRPIQMGPVETPDSSSTEALDAIIVIEPSGLFGDTILRIPSGGLFQGSGIHYFTPEPFWDVTDSLTVVYGMNNEYRLGYYGRDGTLQRIVSKPADPRPITERDIRALFSFLDRAWLEAGVPPSNLAANHELVHFAESFPAFAAFHLGPRNSLWVQPVRSPGDLSDEELERYNFVEDFGGSDWEVFDADGHYLGVVPMPTRFTPRVFLGDRIYGVARDELDVQYVVRLRIRYGGDAELGELVDLLRTP